MRSPKKPHTDTHDQLLHAAAEVFADKGYTDATIANICEKAGANIAAVNYHFGDKETLYAEAWRLAFHHSIEAHPPDGGVAADASAEEQLRGRVLSLMRRIVDPDCHEFEMVHKELANPTGLLVEVMRECIGPLRRGMANLVRQLLGDGATDTDVDLCQMSVIAQCLHPMIRLRYMKAGPKAHGPGARLLPGPPPPKVAIETLADHVVGFSLAGIRDMRKRIKNRNQE